MRENLDPFGNSRRLRSDFLFQELDWVIMGHYREGGCFCPCWPLIPVLASLLHACADERVLATPRALRKGMYSAGQHHTALAQTGLGEALGEEPGDGRGTFELCLPWRVSLGGKVSDSQEGSAKL